MQLDAATRAGVAVATACTEHDKPYNLPQSSGKRLVKNCPKFETLRIWPHLRPLRSGCVPEMCTSPGTTGYTVKSVSLERAHFKADVVCDEENGALAFEYEEVQYGITIE